MTPRDQVRAMLRGGISMTQASRLLQVGLISSEAHARFERLFAWGTATEHYLTIRVPFERWKARRERVRRAIQRVTRPEKVAAASS